MATDQMTGPPVPHQRFHATKGLQATLQFLILGIGRLKTETRVVGSGIDPLDSNALDKKCHHASRPFEAEADEYLLTLAIHDQIKPILTILIFYEH